MDSPVWRCVDCSHEEAFRELYRCPRCGGELSLEYDCEALRKQRSWRSAWGQGQSLWERFTPLLPPLEQGDPVTLGEGGTPLVPAPRLARRLGLCHVYLKLEQCNPTGSFKDRQVAVAFCKALEWRHRVFGIASSGNAGVSLAAFCARAGCTANIWVSDATPSAKLSQMQVFGARLFILPDPAVTGDMARYYAVYTDMGRFCAERDLVPMVTARRVNPLVVEGAKSIAFEIALQLKKVPDKVFVPVGGGGLCGGTWKGFEELSRVGLIDRLPRVFGAQYGGDRYLEIDRIGANAVDSANYYVPLDGVWARESIVASGGMYLGKVDARLEEAQVLLASLEGVFAEPAGAVATAGLLTAVDQNLVQPTDWVVCYVTGHGLKNTERTEQLCRSRRLGERIPVEDLASSAAYLSSGPGSESERGDFV